MAGRAGPPRFGRIGGAPVLTMTEGSWQKYSSDGVLNFLSFDQYAFDLSPFTNSDETIRYKPADLGLTQLLDPRHSTLGRYSA